MEELDVVDALVQTSFLVQGVLVEVAAGHDASISQLRLLGVLRDREPGMQELARILGLDKSSATGLVDRAEARGLVRRQASASDRRAVTVSLTPAGRKVIAAGVREMTTRVAAITAPLTAAQTRDLAHLLSRVLDA